MVQGGSADQGCPHGLWWWHKPWTWYCCGATEPYVALSGSTGQDFTMALSGSPGPSNHHPHIAISTSTSLHSAQTILLLFHSHTLPHHSGMQAMWWQVETNFFSVKGSNYCLFSELALGPLFTTIFPCCIHGNTYFDHHYICQHHVKFLKYSCYIISPYFQV